MSSTDQDEKKTGMAATGDVKASGIKEEGKNVNTSGTFDEKQALENAMKAADEAGRKAAAAKAQARAGKSGNGEADADAAGRRASQAADDGTAPSAEHTGLNMALQSSAAEQPKRSPSMMDPAQAQFARREVHFDPAIDTSANDITKYLDDTKRDLYDFIDDESDFYRIDEGLTPDIVEQISREKHDPQWMHDFRLRSLELYNKQHVPAWGPPIDGLNMDKIVTYVRPNTDMKAKWEDVPEEIKSAFDKLGIPKAEHEYLAGVGAQYDSELVYHSLQDFVAQQGVVYSDMESALTGDYADMVKEYFMKLVPPTDHKFAALHGAVWSGGSFVYVPKGVHVEVPLQSYFRLNAKGAGQFEHTLIIVDEGADLHFIEGCSAPKWNVANLHAGCVELYVKKNARLRYSTVENWSKNMYNLNTKRALVEEGGRMEWVSGSFGSHVSYLYPTTVLRGDNSSCEYTGITFAGKGQNLDTGARMVHIGKNTSSLVTTKSISKDGGIGTFRSAVEIHHSALHAKSSTDCQSLMTDRISRSDTIPEMDVRTSDADVGHEAKIGRISEEAVFYLMSRGISEDEARAMIVSGFANPVSKELPLEYAAEMNNLIKLEMEGNM